jgi:hypothetical protein
MMANEQDRALIPAASVLLLIFEVEAASPQPIGDPAVEKYQRKLTIYLKFVAIHEPGHPELGENPPPDPDDDGMETS